jgi:hypothetical protein
MIFSSVTEIAALGFAGGLLVGIVTALLLRRRRILRRIAIQSTTRFMYSGNLKQTNLLDALQFLELGRREGILHIYVGRRKGYITFVGGQIVDAFFRDTTGKEAIFQMLELDYGDFYFESKGISQPRVITESMMDIALEWDARRYGGAFGGEPMWEEPPPAEKVPEHGADAEEKTSEQSVPAAGDAASPIDAESVAKPSSALSPGEGTEPDEAIVNQTVPAEGDALRPEELGEPPGDATNSLKAGNSGSEES